MKAIVITTLYIVSLLVVCCQSKKGEGYNRSDKKVDTLLTKYIHIPRGLSILNKDIHTNYDSTLDDLFVRRKLFSIHDGTCLSCIDEMNKLDSVFNVAINTNNNARMIFILNIRKTDSVYFMFNFRAAIHVRGVVFWDDAYRFESANRMFSANRDLRTFLTSPEGRVETYGNPLWNEELIVRYKNKVQ